VCSSDLQWISPKTGRLSSPTDHLIPHYRPLSTNAISSSPQKSADFNIPTKITCIKQIIKEV